MQTYINLFKQNNDHTRIMRAGISVTESLTAKRINMFEKAREEYTFNNVWSQDGKIVFW